MTIYFGLFQNDKKAIQMIEPHDSDRAPMESTVGSTGD